MKGKKRKWLGGYARREADGRETFVIERRINPENDELELLVEWQEDGQPVRRWIDADKVEEVAA